MKGMQRERKEVFDTGNRVIIKTTASTILSELIVDNPSNNMRRYNTSVRWALKYIPDQNIMKLGGHEWEILKKVAGRSANFCRNMYNLRHLVPGWKNRKVAVPKTNIRYRLTDLATLEMAKEYLKQKNTRVSWGCYRYIVLAQYTGMRFGEMRTLTEDMVDYNQKLIFLRKENCKTGQSRNIPMHPEVEIILKSVFKSSQYKTFDMANGNRSNQESVMASHISRLMKEGGFPFSIHDVRHFFASYALQEGMSLPEIAYVLGHANINMTLRYTHMLDGAMKKKHFAVFDKMSAEAYEMYHPKSKRKPVPLFTPITEQKFNNELPIDIREKLRKKRAERAAKWKLEQEALKKKEKVS